MAEIKSTLEIIMEKTKNLTLTDEEKKAFRKKEIQGKVRGFITRFMDGLMNLENLKKEIASYEEDDAAVAREVLIGECLDRIDPVSDNTPVFDILAHVAAVDITSLQKLLSDFLVELDREREVHEQRLENRIREKGFSGSAVLPNINADPEWTYFVQEVKKRLQEEIQSLAQQMI